MWRTIRLRLGERDDGGKPSRSPKKRVVTQQSAVRALFPTVIVRGGGRVVVMGSDVAAPCFGCRCLRGDGQAPRDDRTHDGKPHGEETEPCNQSSMCTVTIHAQPWMSPGQLVEALLIIFQPAHQ